METGGYKTRALSIRSVSNVFERVADISKGVACGLASKDSPGEMTDSQGAQYGDVVPGDGALVSASQKEGQRTESL
jgi:hypothetical protein